MVINTGACRLHCLAPPSIRMSRHVNARPGRAMQLLVAAIGPANKDQDDAVATIKTKRVRELESSLKKMGLDKSTAQQILQIWRQSGATTPEGLRKLFLKRSISKSGQIGVQLLVDASAGLGAYYAARTITPEELGTWSLAAKYGFYFLAMYLLIGASFEFFSLCAVLYAGFRYSTRADTFLLAVQDIAGASSGVSLVDQAKQAVNIVKVLAALDRIRELLKEVTAENMDSFFEDLSVYLTLERAQRLYGFDAARYGLDDAGAADIAAVFARYDVNDDGLLSLDEFTRLCAENRAELSEAEVKAAFDVLDTDKSGALDMGEWVEWWLQKGRGYTWAEEPPKGL